MYTVDYRLPAHSADGNWVILDDNITVILIDPDAVLDPDSAERLARLTAEWLNVSEGRV